MEVILLIMLCFGFGVVICYIMAFFFHGRSVFFKSDILLKGKTAIITGGTSGLGLATAEDLARRRARVIIAGSNSWKGEQAVQELRLETSNHDIYYKQLDLSCLRSVRQFAYKVIEEETQLHILVNCAGISHSVKSTTDDGYDKIFCVNYLGHFLLTYLLLDVLTRTGSSRIVNVSSLSHAFLPDPLNTTAGLGKERTDPAMDETINDGKDFTILRLYPKLRGYDCSKLAVVLHAKALTARLAETSVTCNAVQPNMCLTNIWTSIKQTYGTVIFYVFCIVMWPFFKSPYAAAQTIIYACVAPELETVSGKYLRQCAPHWEGKQARSMEVADSLWDISSRLTGCPGSMPCFSGYVPQADVSSNMAAFSEVLNNRLLGQGGEKILDVNIERL